MRVVCCPLDPDFLALLNIVGYSQAHVSNYGFTVYTLHCRLRRLHTNLGVQMSKCPYDNTQSRINRRQYMSTALKLHYQCLTTMPH